MKEKNKIRCEYPICKKEAFFKRTFDLINEEGSCVELSFCKYHYLVVMGGHFKTKIIPEAKNLLGEKRISSFKLVGPIKEVEIIEQVIAAREMIQAEKTKA